MCNGVNKVNKMTSVRPKQLCINGLLNYVPCSSELYTLWRFVSLEMHRGCIHLESMNLVLSRVVLSHMLIKHD